MTSLILPFAGPKVFCISKGSPEVVFDTLCVPGRGTVSPAVQKKVKDGAKVTTRRDIFLYSIRGIKHSMAYSTDFEKSLPLLSNLWNGKVAGLNLVP